MFNPMSENQTLGFELMSRFQQRAPANVLKEPAHYAA
jgi:hypothetical protein